MSHYVKHATTAERSPTAATVPKEQKSRSRDEAHAEYGEKVPDSLSSDGCKVWDSTERDLVLASTET